MYCTCHKYLPLQAFVEYALNTLYTVHSTQVGISCAAAKDYCKICKVCNISSNREAMKQLLLSIFVCDLQFCSRVFHDIYLGNWI